MLTKSRSFEDMPPPPQHTSSDWHDPRYEDHDLLLSVYGRVHAIIPGRLAFVIHEDETKTKEQARTAPISLRPHTLVPKGLTH